MKSLFFGGLLLLAVSAFAQDRTPPAPPSLPALQRELNGLFFGAKDTPSLAVTHDQAQKLVPLLQRWKTANFNLAAADAQSVWDQVQTVLTADQKAYKFTPTRPQGQGQGGMGQGGDRSGSPQDRQARMFDRLIQRLSAL
jgi:hypothetical protein